MRTMFTDSFLPPIVCCIDDRYALPFCVLLESLIQSHHPDIINQFRVLVIHDGLSHESVSQIDHHANRLGIAVEYRAAGPVDSRYPTNGPQPGQFTHSVYLRLMIGDVLTAVPRV